MCIRDRSRADVERASQLRYASRVLHFLARVSAFAVFATGLAGCSLLLDWSDYTDGFADAAAGAGDTGQPTGPADAGHPDETNQPDEAGTDSAAIEAGGNPPDASPDAGGDSLVPPPCSPTTCMGDVYKRQVRR